MQHDSQIAVECFRPEKFLKTVETPVANGYPSPYFFTDVIVTMNLRLKVIKAVDSFEEFSILFQRMVQWFSFRHFDCHVFRLNSSLMLKYWKSENRIATTFEMASEIEEKKRKND